MCLGEIAITSDLAKMAAWRLSQNYDGTVITAIGPGIGSRMLIDGLQNFSSLLMGSCRITQGSKTDSGRLLHDHSVLAGIAMVAAAGLQVKEKMSSGAVRPLLPAQNYCGFFGLAPGPSPGALPGGSLPPKLDCNRCVRV